MGIGSDLAANEFMVNQVALSLGSLKHEIAAAKNAPLWQKAAAVEKAVDHLFDVVEDIADNQANLLKLSGRLSARLDYVAQRSGHVLDAVEGL